MSGIRPGPRNSLTDVGGLLVGNAEDKAALSGTTVVLCDGIRAVAAADVRGGGPGTRETDALAPARLVDGVDAVVLSGGSAYGLDAAGSVAAWLGARRRGFDTGDTQVPIVPAAILYDLANGGDKNWGEEPPYRALGRAAAEAASADFALGRAGAGYGARAGSLAGGLGTASAVDPTTGATVAALAAVNCFGEVVFPDGRFFAAPFEQQDEFGGLGASGGPADPEPAFPKLAGKGRGGGRGAAPAHQNTTIAVVATDAILGHTNVQRMTVMAQAGLGRAVRPVYTPFDGDTVFGLATGTGPAVDLVGLARIGAIAADCLARAVARGVYRAAAHPGGAPGWRDRFGPNLMAGS